MNTSVRVSFWPLLLVISSPFMPAPAVRAQTNSEKAELLAILEKANSLQEQGRHAEAITLREVLLARCRRIFGPQHRYTGAAMNNLASLYQDMGRYAEAEPLFRRSLEIAEKQPGRDNSNVAASLNNLASLYQHMGRYAEAEPLLRRSLEIGEQQPARDDPDVASRLNSLAILYRAVGRHAEAEPLLRRSLEICERALGRDHPHVAGILNNLAILCQDMGRYAEAEPLFRRSKEICERQLGPDHPDVAICLNNLANLFQDMGRYAEAELLHRRSLAINEQRLGPDHPHMASSLHNLANLYAVQEHWTDAAHTFDPERRILRRHIRRTLPALAEPEQLSFLKANDEHKLHNALSLGLLRRDDLEIARLSAGWVLNGKAVTQESLAGGARLARDSQDPNAARFVSQLRTVQARLARLSQAEPQPGQQEDRRRELDRLIAQEREYSKQLGQLTGYPERDEPWVELDEVRKALPEGAVLVEYSRFKVANFQAQGDEPKWLPSHYAVWIIPAEGRGEVQIIDLGPAEPIEQAVATTRTVLQPDPEAMKTVGEEEVEKQAREPLRALAKLVLEPLRSHIDPHRRWILSPDAALWLVPWAALPLNGDRYAVEDHTIQYVISGRDLVQARTKPGTARPIVLADPDFDLDTNEARLGARQVLRRLPAPSTEERALRGLSRSFGSRRAPRLPGTADEALAITPTLKSYTGAEPIVYTDRWALEAVFKAFRRPPVVVLSTHGFFLPAPESKPEDRPLLEMTRTRPPVDASQENPLLRCGLLLAGCNRRGAATGQEDEDGVLTGLEIVGVDLRGTELVVLSACETGLGDVRTGEGVAGLRQAFQLAGARSVVATLWQVPDADSARLMSRFFDELATRRDKAEALRQAQLERIASHRKRYGGAHPFFWAAYTVTGQSD